MTKPIDKIDLEGRFVVMDEKSFKLEYKGVVHRIFFCNGGFGCNPSAVGTKIFGQFVSDGEACYIRRYDIERLATKEEIALAKEEFGKTEYTITGKQLDLLNEPPNRSKLRGIGPRGE